jgi:hypothetical protein
LDGFVGNKVDIRRSVDRDVTGSAMPRRSTEAGRVSDPTVDGARRCANVTRARTWQPLRALKELTPRRSAVSPPIAGKTTKRTADWIDKQREHSLTER